MSESLPERPDLRQLRRRAKELRDAARRGDAAALGRLARHHPTPPQGAASLAAAQLVIARELGYASWPALKAAVDAGAAPGQALNAFVAASVDGHPRQASAILRADPAIAGRSLLAAAVLGDAAAARTVLAADPAAAVALDDERGWPPLLYACYSRWHQIDPGRAAGLAQVVRVLLEAGASPDTNDGGRPRFRSALKGAVEADNPEVAEVLLAAGASPDLGQPVGEAVGHRDQRCLQLLLAHGASLAGTWAVGAAVHHDDPGALALLLDALQGSDAARMATEALPGAAAHASLPVVAALLDAGADPGAGEDGVSALRLAVRAGRADAAARPRAAGAPDDVTDLDRFIGACISGDRPAAEGILAANPDLPGRLTGQDQAVIVDAAGTEADVHSVEVDRDAVVLGLAVGGRAEGARPAPRQQLYQVFTVEDSQITGIRGYPDRHSALTRDQPG